jgi:hypothetical protein
LFDLVQFTNGIRPPKFRLIFFLKRFAQIDSLQIVFIKKTLSGLERECVSEWINKWKQWMSERVRWERGVVLEFRQRVVYILSPKKGVNKKTFLMRIPKKKFSLSVRWDSFVFNHWQIILSLYVCLFVCLFVCLCVCVCVCI